MSKCNCFEEVLNKVKPKIMEQVPEGATELSIDWHGRTYMLNGKEHAPVNPKIAVSFRKQGKGGLPARNLSKDTITITASHCAFCGYKYNSGDTNAD